jgi:hypothetical protein
MKPNGRWQHGSRASKPSPAATGRRRSASGQQVIHRVGELHALAGTARHADPLASCLRRLDIFRLSRQLATLDQIIRRLTDDRSACLPVSEPAGR